MTVGREEKPIGFAICLGSHPRPQGILEAGQGLAERVFLCFGWLLLSGERLTVPGLERVF